MENEKHYIKLTMLGGLILILLATVATVIFRWLYIDLIQPMTNFIFIRLEINEIFSIILLTVLLLLLCFIAGLVVNKFWGRSISNLFPSKVTSNDIQPPIVAFPTPQLQEIVSAQNRVVPVSKELIDEPRFALDPLSLERYERAREYNKDLPSKRPVDLQKNQIAKTFEGLKLGRAFAIKRAIDKNSPEEDSTSSGDALPPPDDDVQRLIIRSIKSVVKSDTSDWVERIKKTDQDIGIPGSMMVKFKEIRDTLLPDKSMTAPDNSLVAYLQQHYPKAVRNTVDANNNINVPESSNSDGHQSLQELLEKISTLFQSFQETFDQTITANEPSDDDTTTTSPNEEESYQVLLQQVSDLFKSFTNTIEAETFDIDESNQVALNQLSTLFQSLQGIVDDNKMDSGNSKRALLRRIEKLIDSAQHNIEQPEENSKSAPALYQTLGEGKPLVGPSDAEAHYDFFDLKIAWTPIWSKVIGKINYGKGNDLLEAPSIVLEFLPEFNLDYELWSKYRTFQNNIHGNWEDIIIAAATSQLYLEFLNILAPGETISSEIINERKRKIDSLANQAGQSPSEQWSMYKELQNIQITEFERIKRNDLQATNKIQMLYSPHHASWIYSMPSGYAPWKSNYMQYFNLRYQLKLKWEAIINDEYIKNTIPDANVAYIPNTAERGLEFPIFAPGLVNYGLLLNYRQVWKPGPWQVGDLIKTIPLAPKETRKYKTVVKENKKRSRKEIEKSLNVRKSDDLTTTRAEAEAVQRANEKTGFSATVGGDFNVKIGPIGGDVKASSTFNTNAGKDSADTKRKFRESVAKAASELRTERQTEILEENSESYESEFANEISNPNEEITVTYLFYELQRRYETTERLHKLESVILIAEDVPHHDSIDWTFIRDHDWIIKRTLLDDSFIPAIDFVLEGKVALQTKVDNAKDRMTSLQTVVKSTQKMIKKLSNKAEATEEEIKFLTNIIHELSRTDEPFFVDVAEGLFSGDEGSQIAADNARRAAAQERLELMTQKLSGIKAEEARQRDAFDRAIDSFNKAKAELEYKNQHVDRLIEHLREFLLYYMQAIWSYEPTDQRYLRLFDRKVPFFDYPEDDADVLVRVRTPDNDLEKLPDNTPFEVILPEPEKAVERRLDDIADLNDLLGVKGNYLIFPLRRQSYLNAYMAQEYFGADIDQTAKSTGGSKTNLQPALSSYSDYNNIYLKHLLSDPDKVAVLKEIRNNYISSKDIIKQSTLDDTVKTTLDELIDLGKFDPSSKPEEIIVPTNNLYIEALPGSHPLLEGFKLKHRAVDVEKAKAEHRAMVLENIRAEARLLNLEFGDPQVDKFIQIKGNANTSIGVSGDSN